ncbi:efflux RND transporter periplasmic adaptor subunit [Parendozoicomonas haliclonae]|uniref:Inner membrane protein YiaV n=1 Tax=Parendozoicomonas haliclonae TaxID=1960125 RepID=A0A1X7ALK2_9GAMM|nr:hypothetical protein [Parendozoicomonas haliclonae]SMA48881.1 Inner membrane protein YiaV precursor [Parendozoicomonas haliclonae]
MRLPAFLSSKWALPGIAAGGLLVLIAAGKLASGPQHSEQQETPLPVEIQVLTVVEHEPSVSGHGIVKASVELQQIAEVAARVVWVSPALVQGAILAEGEVLVQLDDTDYQLAMDQALAQHKMVNAQQQELLSSEVNLGRRLELVSEKVVLAEKELTRRQQLAKQGSLSQSQLDVEQQKFIGLQQEQSSLEQQLDALPSHKQNLAAQLASAEATIAQQQRNIDRTRITMPVNGRIRSVSVEVDAFKAQGQVLFEAIGMEQVEIEAQFSLEKLRPFYQLAFDGQTISHLSLNELAEKLKNTGLRARISLPVAPGEHWQGKVVALREGLNPGSHTMGVVIHVDQPYGDIVPGQRPPLLAELQVDVELIGEVQPLVSVPLSALHSTASGQALFLAYPRANTKEDNSISHRLHKQLVTPKLLSGDHALFTAQQLQSLINDKAELVLSDIAPAIEGMALSAQQAELKPEMVLGE